MSPDAAPPHPVPEAAIDALLDAVRRQVGPLPPLVDLGVAAAEARRFKLDVSFVLPFRGAPAIRFSVNDKGEPGPFRERVRALLPGAAAPFLALCPPGRVQTTCAVKYRPGDPRPERLSLYYEELASDPDPLRLMAEFYALAGLPAPRAAMIPVAVAVDFAGNAIAGLKDYWMTEDPGDLFPAWQALLPVHPFRGTRRFLVARRHPDGQKLLWMPECHRPEAAAAAWEVVDRLAPPGPMTEALRALRRDWTFADWLHPDLVCLDADGEGHQNALIVYVSVR